MMDSLTVRCETLQLISDALEGGRSALGLPKYKVLSHRLNFVEY